MMHPLVSPVIGMPDCFVCIVGSVSCALLLDLRRFCA